MQGYTAWCLYYDLNRWKGLADSGYLEWLYDPRPTRDFLEVLADRREVWESVLGEVEEQTDAEAESEAEAARQVGEARAARLERWLTNPPLNVWYRTLKALGKKPSLYKLFEEDERTVRRRLEKLGIPYAYQSYADTSSIVHGSTLENTLHLTGSVASPMVGSSGRELDSALDQATSWAQWNTLGLWLLCPSQLA